MRKGSRAKVQIGLRPVRRRKDGGKITEYGLRSTEGWQAVGCCAANGRDAVAPLPATEWLGGCHVFCDLPCPRRYSKLSAQWGLG